MITDEQIFDILDGSADTATLQRHQELLASDKAYALRFQKMAQLNDSLTGLSVESPSMRFTQNVMERVLPVPSSQTARATSLIWAVVAFAAAMVVVSFFYALNNFSPDSAPQLDVSIQQFFSQLADFNVQKIIILIFGFVTLYFFDATILKPRFQKK
jgi:anti-sigma factor RsiW